MNGVGPIKTRIRFPLEIVKAVREAAGDDFIIIYRLSMLDLVEDGSSWDEVIELAKAIEAAGATIINTGIRLARSAHSNHCHHGSKRRIFLGDSQAYGAGQYTPSHIKPNQHPRNCGAHSE